MTHRIYVYGTLRPFNSETVRVPGVIYDLGWFPGASLIEVPSVEPPTFLCEIIEVDDDGLKRLDQYEGYYESSPESSLYIRRPYLDGYIYVYNHDFNNRPMIESGDWEGYSKAKGLGRKAG